MLGDALFQMNRGIKELRLLIGLETHHGRLSMNRGVANPINTSAHMQRLFGQQPDKN
jgi:hypothetical protein